MANGDQGFPVMQEIANRIQRAYEWDALAQPAPRGYDPPVVLDLEVIELSSELLEDYVGEYQINEQQLVAVTLTNGQLMAAPAGQPPAQLFATEVDHFFLQVAPVEVFFERDDEGDVISLAVVQRGQRQVAPKVR